MRFWPSWNKSKAVVGEQVQAAGTSGEALEVDVRMVWLPPRESPRVWKTRSFMLDSEFIYLHPPEQEWETTLPHDQDVTVYLMNGEAVTDFDCRVERRMFGGAPVLCIAPPGDAQWKSRIGAGGGPEQRRQHIRADVAILAECSPLVYSSSGASPKAETALRCRIVNLSAGGALMVAEAELTPDCLVRLTFPPHLIPLQVTAKVLRSREASLEFQRSFPCQAALSFNEMADSSRALIGRYVVDRLRNRIPHLENGASGRA